MTERRRHFRRRTLLDGHIEISKLNGWRLDCTVRNLSDAGAQLVLPGNVVVPQHVSLAVSRGTQRPAQLIWYRNGKAGFSLGERRASPRPAPANDVAPAPKPAGTSRLRMRIDAIAGREPSDRPHFTGI